MVLKHHYIKKKKKHHTIRIERTYSDLKNSEKLILRNFARRDGFPFRIERFRVLQLNGTLTLYIYLNHSINIKFSDVSTFSESSLNCLAAVDSSLVI